MRTAILLAGGFGTRIKDLYPSVPKPMIPAAGKPFLDWAIAYWKREGVDNFVLSLGHLAAIAQTYFSVRPEVRCVVEPRALGTGGAVRFAAANAEITDPFVVANGDSLVAADTRQAWELLNGDSIDGVLLGVRVADASRYGTLAVSADNRLEGFREKQPGAGLINGGVYFLRRRTLDRFPAGEPLSMETDVFPALLAAGCDLRVVAVDAPFLDIGTPESVCEAEAFVRGTFGGGD